MKLQVKSQSQWMISMNQLRWAFSSQTHSKNSYLMLGSILEAKRQLLRNLRISSMTSRIKKKKVFLTRTHSKIIQKENLRTCSMMKVTKWKSSSIKLSLLSLKKVSKKKLNYRNNMITEKFLWKHTIKRKISLRSGFNLSKRRSNWSDIRSRIPSKILLSICKILDKIKRWC